VIRQPNIVSEFSAQRRSHPPNPALKTVLAVLPELIGRNSLGTVADIGCGKLRHYRLLVKPAKKLFLVDTEKQLATTHRDKNQSYTVPQIAKLARENGRVVYALTVEQFRGIRNSVDVAFCVAVFDVITRERRREITTLVSDKLKDNGYFVVIAPRNDSTITRRCVKENRYKDGHVFGHHGLQTFFCNFEKYVSIVTDCADVGLGLRLDLSSYRQVCLIFCNE
jgi:Methyltransferase domain